MKEFDAIIIGGGASGCFCAITALEKHKNILLVDKGPYPAKKLLVTGNGRCNLTNKQVFPSKDFYNQNIDAYLNQCPPLKTLKIFQKLGLVCYEDKEGRVYPISNSAKSVVDVINNYFAKNKNITILSNCNVEKVEFLNGKYIVNCNGENFVAAKIVVATGSQSGIKFAEQFNIKSKPFTPSLVALKTENTKYLEGTRLSPVKISAIINDMQVKDEGEILFKDCGISGIVAFNISSYFARQGNFEGEIFLDLSPTYSQKDLFSLLCERKKLELPINKMFDGLFLPQIGYLILNKCKIDEKRLTNRLKSEEIEKISKIIKNLPLKVKSHYDNNQVFSGGICLSELSEKLECKNQKGLYFCGEVCDVDGLCGGYNLQWAWTSGFIVGENI